MKKTLETPSLHRTLCRFSYTEVFGKVERHIRFIHSSFEQNKKKDKYGGGEVQ